MSSLMDSDELRRKLAELPALLANFKFFTATTTRDAILKLAFGSLASLATYGVYKLLARFYRSFNSPLHILPGPPNDSLIFGNLIQIRDADAAAMHVQWGKEYGPAVRYSAWLCEPRLFTMDPKALNHVLTHTMDYQKPAQARYNLSRLLGDGVLVTEGEKHRQQRRIMNPSFGPSSIKDLTPVFFKKSMQLRDIWVSEVLKAGADKTRVIDVLSWLSRTTLDVIGLAGFDYRFDALNVDEEPNELNKAFSTLFHADNNFSLFQILQAFVPAMRLFPTARGNEEKKAHKTMNRIGAELLHERKDAALGVSPNLTTKSRASTEEYGINGRDLLTALVNSNMDTEIPATQRMADVDVLAQVPTFLVAGHETTSTETMWCLFALAQLPDVQSRLRNELLSVSTDSPSADELNSLPYLDAVVRETLRLHAAVPNTIRIAMRDDVIPLSKPIIDRHGVERHEIRISKGDGVFIPILAMNITKSIWGEDAEDFNPERWFSVPEAAKEIPGVWGHMLTFLGGARSCIGYRFALYEMKALIFTLIRAFEFELSIPADQFKKRSFVVTRPYIKDNIKLGAQMPLNVRLAQKN